MPDGSVYGAAPGQTPVIANVAGVADTVTVTVSPIPVAAVHMSPTLPETVLVRAAGYLRATPLDAGGLPLLRRTVTWTISDPRVAQVSAQGVLTAINPGQTRITATVDQKSDEISINVTVATFTKVASGPDHDCALDTVGQIWCWGDNHFGQLGRGDTLPQPTPTRVKGALVATQITAGGGHTCAIAGIAYCWGSGTVGGVGNGGLDDQSVPVAVTGNHSFLSLSAGADHTCGVDGTGALYCWGSNSAGQLDTNPAGPFPTVVKPGFNFRAVVAGLITTCGVTAGNSGWCWGDNQWGQLGAPPYGYNSPGDTIPLVRFTTFALGDRHTCGLAVDSTAYCWGYDGLGQLGNGSWNSTGPMPVSGALKFSALAAGAEFTCGIASTVVYCWGNGSDGSLGQSTFPALSNVPVPIASTASFVGLSANGLHACALTTTGVIYCWGSRRGTLASLGDGLNYQSGVPLRLPGQP
jgi:alpha-tubulin suppressor-like RCC1 family protein